MASHIEGLEGIDAFGCCIYGGRLDPIITDPSRLPEHISPPKAPPFPEPETIAARLSSHLGPSEYTSLMGAVITHALNDQKSDCPVNSWDNCAFLLLSSNTAESPGHLVPGPTHNGRQGSDGNREGSLKTDMNSHILLSYPFPGATGLMMVIDALPIALEQAHRLLSGKKVEIVIIGAASLPATTDPKEEAAALKASAPTAGVILLKSLDQAREDGDRIYAILDTLCVTSSPALTEPASTVQQIIDLCRQAFARSGLNPCQIGYLEVASSLQGASSVAELNSLARAYQAHGQSLTCALGSVRDLNGSPTLGLNGLAGLIKVALCLYQRFLPATAGWTHPGKEIPWDMSLFYVTNESRTWFLDEAAPKRVAALNSIGPDALAHIILSEDDLQPCRPNSCLALTAPFVLPLAGNGYDDLINQLQNLDAHLQQSRSLSSSARQNYEEFQRQTAQKYALMIVGRNQEELRHEITLMKEVGLAKAFEKKVEWQTINGSFFTANPVGVTGEVAFVYPGVGNAYIGLGQDLFHFFPNIHERSAGMTANLGEVIREKELFPRSLERLQPPQINKLEDQLKKDIAAMGESSISFSMIYTMILRDFLGVTPQAALGYSLGEISMIACLGVWQNPGQLGGIVRELWQLNETDLNDQQPLWESYTLMASPGVVNEAIKGEDRVYLSIINTSNNVVIAGDPASCLRVIDKLGCTYLPLNLDLVAHCPPARSEYNRFAQLCTIPTSAFSGIRFYSSSCYQPIPLRSKSIANSIARSFTEQVDFPRVVNKAYDDGARIFIELGPRQTCSYWIGKILQDKPHATIPMNIKGSKDLKSIVRVVGRLISHRVPVDLAPLFV